MGHASSMAFYPLPTVDLTKSLIPDEHSFEDKPTGSAAFAVLLFLVRQYEETAYPVIVDMPKSVWDARAMEETKTFFEPHYRVLSESHQYDAVTLRLNND